MNVTFELPVHTSYSTDACAADVEMSWREFVWLDQRDWTSLRDSELRVAPTCVDVHVEIRSLDGCSPIERADFSGDIESCLRDVAETIAHADDTVIDDCDTMLSIMLDNAVWRSL